MQHRSHLQTNTLIAISLNMKILRQTSIVLSLHTVCQAPTKILIRKCKSLKSSLLMFSMIARSETLVEKLFVKGEK